MAWKQVFTSSIGKKFIMGLTGLFLITFLVVHAGINACIWANDEVVMFNKAAHFMGSMVVIRIVEVGLMLGILLHTLQGIILVYENKKVRTVGYQINYGNEGSKWYSRSMGLLGTLILLFLLMHLYHFWIPSRFTGLEPVMIDGKEFHNLYKEMLIVFQDPIIVVLYVLGCISLAFHLAHGFQSAFKTFGVFNKKYHKIINSCGNVFSIIIAIIFMAMPITIYLGLVK